MPAKPEIRAAQPPATGDLEELRRAAGGCRACPLWRRATQTVFGEGRAGSRLLLVGEQPGDVEDQAGRPFVGPAGRALDRALADAGLERPDVYLTNAVKHFKWRASGGGKKRLHDKPSWAEIGACLPWLEAEIETVQPGLVVCLGATAAQSLLGRGFRVTRQRGTVIEDPRPTLATIHPSAVLRAPDSAARRDAYAGLVRDLEVAVSHAGR